MQIHLMKNLSRGIFPRPGGHRGKSWRWPPVRGELFFSAPLECFYVFEQVGPQLVEHDLQDIIDSDPVTLPLTRTGLARWHSSSYLTLENTKTFRHSRDFSSPCDEDRQSRLLANQVLHSSPILHFLNCPTQEAQQAVNAVIAQVYSNDTQVIFLFWMSNVSHCDLKGPRFFNLFVW